MLRALPSQVVIAAAYVHAPVFDLRAALVHTADHQVVSVPVGHHTCSRDLVYAVCAEIQHTAKHAAEWSVYEVVARPTPQLTPDLKPAADPNT